MSPPRGRRLGRLIRAGLAAGLLLAARARAGEDAGTESPFARGAGSRGLGMGGAFVAIADDASALIWNPGGLARLERLSLEADYASFEETGSAEQFVGVAAPSWRWGVAGFTVRHLQTGGVDQRDDRNQGLGVTSGGETEMALGYGRALFRGATAGLALKLQSLEIGPASATGFGADFGIVVDAAPWAQGPLAWASPFSLGVALRNAVEPVQTLDVEAVPDPRVLRWGLAWSHDVSSSAALKIGADLEHGGGAAARPHAGAELVLGARLALRTGLDDGALAFGTSVLWQGFSIDYAYLDRDLGAAQRFGISKSIGPTTAESRSAAQRTQERDLAQRLDRAYEDRRREQVASFLARAEASRGAGRAEDALEAVAVARALAPEDARPAQIEAAVLTDEGQRLERAGDLAGASLSYARALEAWAGDSLAAAGRRRAEAALRRLAERSRHAGQIDEAYRLFGTGDLVGARTALLRVAASGDTSSASMLARVDHMLAQRVAERLARAQRDLGEGRLDDVERGLEEARALGAKESDLGQLRSALQVERRRVGEPHATGPAASPRPHEPTEAERGEAERCFERGTRLAAAQQSDAAVRYWELALSLDSGHARARAALEREYLMRGMAAFGRGRFAEAEAAWSRLLELDPSDARSRAYLERARTQIQRTQELTGGR